MDHRRGEVTLTVLDPAGNPATGCEVTVEQRRHAFGFGNIGFDFVPALSGAEPPGTSDVEGFGGGSTLPLDRLAALWLNLFNAATLPFYWGRYEPHRGATDVERLTRTARWLTEQGVVVKGHPLVWHTSQPTWLLNLPSEEVETLLRRRIRDVVGGFAGVIDTWDAINEAVIMPVFTKGENAVTRLAKTRGRDYMIRLAFDEAHRANPSATLLINDFDLSSAYESGHSRLARRRRPDRRHRPADPYAPGLPQRGTPVGSRDAVRAVRPTTAHDREHPRLRAT